MNSYLNSLDYVLWYSGLILEVLILSAGIYHRHRYPAFLSYIGVSAIKTMSLMYVAAHCSYADYVTAYWLGAILRIGFLVAVAIEIFGIFFKPIDTLPAGTIRRMFLIVSLFSVLAIAAACFYPEVSAHPLETFFNTLDRTATFIVLLAVSLVLFQSELAGIPKSMKVYGISIGLLFTLSVDAAATITSHSFQRPIYMGAFTISGIIWFYYFAKPEPKIIPPTREQLEVLLKLATSWQVTERNRIYS